MSAEAKPERDPKVGEIWKGKRHIPYAHNAHKMTITGLETHYVVYEYGSMRWQSSMTRTEWRKWAAGATVIKKGND